MRSKLCATTAFTPSRLVPFAAQSRELPVPYSWPAMTISGVPACLICHRGVVDATSLLAGRAGSIVYAAFRRRRASGS